MIIDLYWLKDGKPVYNRQNLSFEDAHDLLLYRDANDNRGFTHVELILYTGPEGFEVVMDDVIVEKDRAKKALYTFNDNIAKRKYKDIIYAE